MSRILCWWLGHAPTLDTDMRRAPEFAGDRSGFIVECRRCGRHVFIAWTPELETIYARSRA